MHCVWLFADFYDTGQSGRTLQYAIDMERAKYNTIPRNNPVMKAAFKRPASAIGGMCPYITLYNSCFII